MATVAHPYITPEDYLERERLAEFRSEYLNGEVFEMAGGTLDHGEVIGNLVRVLGNTLEAKPCRVVPAELRINVSQSGLYTYPDVTVVCGEPAFLDDLHDTITNPILIAEVLSDSTKSYDRGQKFHYYRGLSSLEEYLTVAQDEIQIEQYTRQPTGQWLLTETKDATAILALQSLDIEVKVSDIYAKVSLS